jgi:hypothetical protein
MKEIGTFHELLEASNGHGELVQGKTSSVMKWRLLASITDTVLGVPRTNQIIHDRLALFRVRIKVRTMTRPSADIKLLAESKASFPIPGSY